MAWSYEDNSNDIIDSPKGKSTYTVSVPPLVIPVNPYGVFAATAAMIVGLAIFASTKRRQFFHAKKH